VFEPMEQQYQNYRIALMVDTSHVKTRQDSIRSALDLEDQKLGKTKGGRNTKLGTYVNLARKAVNLELSSGNEHDSKSFKCTSPSHIEGCFVLADKVKDANEIREFLEQFKTFAVISQKQKRKTRINLHRLKCDSQFSLQ